MKLDRPKIKETNEATIEECALTNQFTNKKFVEKLEKEIQIEDAEFDCCHFIGIDFKLIKSEKLIIWDCIFERCDLSNFFFNKTSLKRCEFINCKLMGTVFDECFLESILFYKVNGRYININGSKIRNIKVKNSDFSEGRIMENNTKNIELEEVNFNSCDFIKTNLNDVDFSNCNIEGINIDLQSLKGMRVNSYQASCLASILGIKIV